MEDEAGRDEKIIAVPVDALAPFYKDVRSYRDLPPIMCEQIAHFFKHYKGLEKGKWVTIVRWLDVKGAEQLVLTRHRPGRKGAGEGEGKGQAKWRISASPASNPPTESATEAMT
jgi:inorganic pyrophosphatase